MKNLRQLFQKAFLEPRRKAQLVLFKGTSLRDVDKHLNESCCDQGPPQQDSFKCLLLFLLMVSVTLPGCLKTRAQLRDDGEDREVSKPVQAQAIQDVQPQGQYVLEELKSEMTRLEGRVEDLERSEKENLKKGNSAEKEEFKKLEAKIIQMEQTQVNLLESLKKLQDSPALVDPNELFKKAQLQYKDGNYEGAAETCGFYLKTPKPKHLEEATFFRGESFYKLKQYKKAIVEYSKFPEKFTRSSHLPVVLYKIGLSFEALGMKEDAKGFYQELVEKFPKSPEGKKAKKKVK